MRRFLILALLLIFAGPCLAGGIELLGRVEVELEGSAVGVASATDDSKIFILTDKGELVTLNNQGVILGSVEVGKGFTEITPLQGSTKVILSGPQAKGVEIVTLDEIFDINVAGSPFKGDAGAEVLVVSFMDFQ